MSERAAPQSFSFAAGETVSVTFATDVVVSGMTPRFALKRRAGDAAAVRSTADANATAVISAAQQVTIGVTDENTEFLAGTYRYSVEVEDGAGAKSEVAWGYMTFKPSMV